MSMTDIHTLISAKETRYSTDIIEFTVLQKCKLTYPGWLNFHAVFSRCYSILGLFICTLSVMSNIFNVIILSKRWLRRPTTTILIGIAAVDLLLSVSLTPIYILLLLIQRNPSFYQDIKNPQNLENLIFSNTSVIRELFLTHHPHPILPRNANCSDIPHVHVPNYSKVIWLYNFVNIILLSKCSAFVFNLVNCISLTTHTISVWFGAILAIFRWWLIQKLNKQMNRMKNRIDSNLGCNSNQPEVNTPGSAVHVTQLCVDCGRSLVTVNGQVMSEDDYGLKCPKCIQQCETTNISLNNQTSKLGNQNMIQPDGKCQSSSSHPERQLTTLPESWRLRIGSVKYCDILMISPTKVYPRRQYCPDCPHIKYQCLTGLRQFRSCFLCTTEKNYPQDIQKFNIGFLLSMTSLTVMILLIPYYITTEIRSVYREVSAPQWNVSHPEGLSQTLCIDNTTTIQAILVGYRPTRISYTHQLESYNFWAVAGLGKLLPCALILIFGLRLLSQLRANISRRLALVTQSDINSESLYMFGEKHFPQSMRKRLRKHRRTSCLLLMVILLNIPVELPSAVLMVMSRYNHQGACAYLSLGDLLDILALVKNTLTFVLYCVMSSEFRNAFKHSIKSIWTLNRCCKVEIRPK